MKSSFKIMFNFKSSKIIVFSEFKTNQEVIFKAVEKK